MPALQVGILPEGDPHDPNNFVFPIRLDEPFAQIRRKGLIETHLLDTTLAGLQDLDAVVLQRAPFPDLPTLEQGCTRLQAFTLAGGVVIYELDDDLFCPQLQQLIAMSRIDELDHDAHMRVKAHKQLLSLAQVVVVSTPALAEVVSEYGARQVLVAPTGLDFQNPCRRLPPGLAERVDTLLQLGWMGGSRVGTDLELLVPVFKKLQACVEQPFRLIIGGSTKYAALFDFLDDAHLIVLPWEPYETYWQRFSHFDLALIPMQDHCYNRCKTPLKVIEFAAMGIRSVCSPVRPFVELAQSDISPIFAASETDWFQILSNALCQRDAFPRQDRKLAMSARALPFFEACSETWQRLFFQIQRGKHGKRGGSWL